MTLKITTLFFQKRSSFSTHGETTVEEERIFIYKCVTFIVTIPSSLSFFSRPFFLFPKLSPWVPSAGDQTNHWSLLATSPPANPPTTTSGRGHAPEKLVINAKKIVEIAFEIY